MVLTLVAGTQTSGSSGDSVTSGDSSSTEVGISSGYSTSPDSVASGDSSSAEVGTAVGSSTSQTVVMVMTSSTTLVASAGQSVTVSAQSVTVWMMVDVMVEVVISG